MADLPATGADAFQIDRRAVAVVHIVQAILRLQGNSEFFIDTSPTYTQSDIIFHFCIFTHKSFLSSLSIIIKIFTEKVNLIRQ